MNVLIGFGCSAVVVVCGNCTRNGSSGIRIDCLLGKINSRTDNCNIKLLSSHLLIGCCVLVCFIRANCLFSLSRASVRERLPQKTFPRNPIV
jgi:hypothetical protein